VPQSPCSSQVDMLTLAYAFFRLWVFRLCSPQSAHSLNYPTAAINSAAIALLIASRYAYSGLRIKKSRKGAATRLGEEVLIKSSRSLPNSYIKSYDPTPIIL